MRISDWSSDVCSSDLLIPADASGVLQSTESKVGSYELNDFFLHYIVRYGLPPSKIAFLAWHAWRDPVTGAWPINFPESARNGYDLPTIRHRSEEHTSELQSLMRISYAVFCLQKKKLITCTYYIVSKTRLH